MTRIVKLEMQSCHNDVRGNDAVFLRVERKSFSRTIQSNLYEVCSFCNIEDR